MDCANLKPLKIVINSGNGAAGPTVDAINKKLKEKGVKTNFAFVHHEPDPTFPNGIPNPLLKENRSSTAKAVIEERADFGVAFDGDFDRCFFFDHSGDFIRGEYVVGLLAELRLGVLPLHLRKAVPESCCYPCARRQRFLRQSEWQPSDQPPPFSARSCLN